MLNLMFNYQFNFSWSQSWECFLLLFTIIDIIGNIPIIIALGKERKNTISPILISSWAGIIFISFLFLGQTILKWLNVDIQSFAVAGSLVLFFIAIELVLGIDLNKTGKDEFSGGGFVPVVFPLIAGPGSLTLILTLRADHSIENVIAGILLNIIVIFLGIKFSSFFARYLSDSFWSVVKKVFGIILLTISIRIFSDYAPQLFQK